MDEWCIYNVGMADYLVNIRSGLVDFVWFYVVDVFYVEFYGYGMAVVVVYNVFRFVSGVGGI